MKGLLSQLENALGSLSTNSDMEFNIYKSDWKLPDEVKRFLQDELDYSQFPLKTGNHIEILI